MAAFSPDAVPAGTKAFGHVPVVDSLAVSTSLPVGVVRASIDGPTLAVTAGLFPSEYAGIEAAARLYAQTNPADLRCGTLLILPCVNLHGFQFRTPWLNVKHTAAAPFDGQNLNAMFPGSSATDASLSSRQAAACFQVVKKATAHIDFRGGDLSESHLVHTIFPQLHDEPQLDRQRMEIALAFGLQYNLSASPTDAHSQGGAGDGSCMGELLKLGCLSFVSECGLGYLTQPREEFILNHVNGTRNVLRYLGMMAGVPRYQHAALGPQRFLLNPFVKAYAPESGVFTAKVDQGQIFTKGDVIGHIGGLDGTTLGEVVAPISGIVHEMYPQRVVFAGEPVFNLVALGLETGFVFGAQASASCIKSTMGSTDSRL